MPNIPLPRERFRPILEQYTRELATAINEGMSVAVVEDFLDQLEEGSLVEDTLAALEGIHYDELEEIDRQMRMWLGARPSVYR